MGMEILMVKPATDESATSARAHVGHKIRAKVRANFILFFVGEREYVERVATGGMAHVSRDGAGDLAGTSAAQTCRHGNVLVASHAEGDGEALHRGSQTRLPEDSSGFYINGFEDAVEVAYEGYAAGCREYGGQEGGALRQLPVFFHGFYIV